MTNYLEGARQNQIRRFREAAVGYYAAYGRKSLPWRRTTDPWKILLAEMLLRKTTALQVEPVYRILAKLTPRRLREHRPRALERMLKPLGIQKERTRLLLEVADRVDKEGRRQLTDRDFLMGLPGVGPYAANMVLTGALREALPGLDRNMIRVVGRVFSVRSVRPRPHTDPDMWEAAAALVPRDKAREYNWGVLDAAAAVCRPRKPRCGACPFEELCDFAGMAKVQVR